MEITTDLYIQVNGKKYEFVYLDIKEDTDGFIKAYQNCKIKQLSTFVLKKKNKECSWVELFCEIQ